MLVDDDSAVRTALARVLASEGWAIVTAAGGEEALERLAESRPDLLITDLSMGEVSGWDLLFHENIQRPQLPIFVITARPYTESEGANQIAAEFFQKPLDLDALVAAVHRVLGTAPSPQT
ncbi:MAG: response regulator [Verrucomicrobia bacterium]|nr:response regulator [Verrucomicrobiota bacterium]